MAVLEEEAGAARVRAVFGAARALGVRIVVSPLTLGERLTKPGLSAEETRFREAFCLSTEGIEFGGVAFDADFARRIAYHRQRAYPQKPPDCVPYACAERLGCDAIPSNDARFVRQCPVRGILTDDIEI